jgi:hypothetical protein
MPNMLQSSFKFRRVDSLTFFGRMKSIARALRCGSLIVEYDSSADTDALAGTTIDQFENRCASILKSGAHNRSVGLSREGGGVAYKVLPPRKPRVSDCRVDARVLLFRANRQS